MIVIQIYYDDWKKLSAMRTWKKFYHMTDANIIKWMFQNDIISDEVHKEMGKKVRLKK